jgi:uncharacterized membrane protein
MQPQDIVVSNFALKNYTFACRNGLLPKITTPHFYINCLKRYNNLSKHILNVFVQCDPREANDGGTTGLTKNPGVYTLLLIHSQSYNLIGCDLYDVVETAISILIGLELLEPVE